MDPRASTPLLTPSRAPLAAAPATEEALVADPRAELTPAQMVERKLASLLNARPLPVSQLRTARRTSRGR
jgi:hypothetical protein